MSTYRLKAVSLGLASIPVTALAIFVGVAMFNSSSNIAAPPSMYGDKRDRHIEGLNGRWNVVELVVDGKTIPAEKSPGKPHFQIDGNSWRYSFVLNGKRRIAEFTVSLDTDRLPHTMDAELRSGAFAGGVCKGVYELEGDMLKLCLADRPSAARPRRLESLPASDLQFFVMHREKASQK